MCSRVRGDAGYTKVTKTALTKPKSGVRGTDNNKKVTKPSTSSQIEKGQGTDV